MGMLAGILRTEDLRPLSEIDVRTTTDALNELAAAYQAERNTWYNFLVQRETTEHQIKHRLGGVDMGQKLGRDGRPVEGRITGQIDVAFPWERYGWSLGWDRETFARMTVGELEENFQAIITGNNARHLDDQFRALFSDDNYTFPDEDWGDLTIRRLANGDGTKYPPLPGSMTEAEANHYLVTGYAAGSMSATNNPFVAAKAKLTGRYGAGQVVVSIINSAQRADVQSKLTGFVDAAVPGIAAGANTALANALDGVSIPGTFLGVEGDSGVYVYVNDEGRVPSNYALTVGVGLAAPLVRRVPREASLQGFQLEADNEHDPLYQRIWRDRFGYAVADRLSAVVTFFDAGSTFTTPAIYASAA